MYIHNLFYAFFVFQISGQGVFVGSGGGMALPRGMHQPGMHPVNPTQGLRAQVPHQFLSAQVCCHFSLILLLPVEFQCKSFVVWYSLNDVIYAMKSNSAI